MSSSVTDDQSTRERLIAAAVDLTAKLGWTGLTMARLAAVVGVSRQTVYNELGGKPQLAEAMVLSELGHFLERVDAAFADHSDDLVEAVEAAAYEVLVMAETNPLLRSALATRQGGESELLPLLTSHSEPLLDMARDLVRSHVNRYETGLDAERLEGLIDIVVRVVLSHVVQPGGDPRETAGSIAWVAARVLG